MTLRTSRAAVAAVCLAACSPKADLLITHGMVWTGLSTGNPQPGGVAIHGGTILAVGDSASLARYVGGATKVIDARGGLVTPGFADGRSRRANNPPLPRGRTASHASQSRYPAPAQRTTSYRTGMATNIAVRPNAAASA